MSDTGIDWSAILDELRRRGIGPSSVAEQIGIPKSTLLGWRDGAQPGHADGEKLLAFWCRVTSSARESAPRIRLYPSGASFRTA